MLNLISYLKDSGISSGDTATLKKLIVRYKCGDKGRIGLKDVVEKLEICLNGHFPESEQ